MKQIVVFYHGNCPDGFSAAWVLWKKFKNKANYIGVQATFFPKEYVNDLKGKEIYFVDGCPPVSLLKKLIKQNENICVIDHHESNKLAIKKIANRTFNMRRSASVLAWQHFFPGKKTPKLLTYIEDVDLWSWKLPYTREITSALELEDYNMKPWDKLIHNIENEKKRKQYIEKGKVIYEYQKKIIGELVGQADLVQFEKKKVFAVNSPILTSDIGNALVKKKGPIGIIWYRQKGKLKVSLRSDGKTNLVKIVEKYGGGGHKSAAGFKLNVDEKLPWKETKK